MGAHLGDAVAAFADRQLDPRALAAAREHLASCSSCREAVAAQQEVRRRLSSSTVGTSATADLVERLRCLGEEPAGALRGRPGTAVRRAAGPSRRGRRPAAATVTGAVVVLAVSVGAAWALGGPTETGQGVRPAVGTFVSQHGSRSSTTTLDDPALDAVSAAYHP